MMKRKTKMAHGVAASNNGVAKAMKISVAYGVMRQQSINGVAVALQQ